MENTTMKTHRDCEAQMQGVVAAQDAVAKPLTNFQLEDRLREARCIIRTTRKLLAFPKRVMASQPDPSPVAVEARREIEEAITLLDELYELLGGESPR